MSPTGLALVRALSEIGEPGEPGEYRPLIVRSESMVPALNVGDVVFVEDIEADQLVVGDIATINDPTIDGSIGILTHRVRAVHAGVGRVAWRVPRIGIAVAWAGSTSARWIVGLFSAGVALVAVMRARRNAVTR